MSLPFSGALRRPGSLHLNVARLAARDCHRRALIRRSASSFVIADPCAAIRISRHRRIGGDLGPLVVVATLGPDTEFAGTARAYRHVMENQQGNRPERVGVVWQFGGTSMRHVSQYHSCNMLMTPCELKRS
jgi:hypothetical protein